jgi:very-short-patch-repair endonuclease
VKREYKRMGWIALRFWEHDLKKNTSEVVSRITTLVS